MRSLLRIAAAAFLASLLAAPLATQAARVGPHGGEVLESSSHEIEISLLPRERRVEAYVLRGETNLPPSLGLLLFDRQGRSTRVELKALGSSAPGTSGPAYRGAYLSQAAGSFIGFELSLPLGREAPLVLRSASLGKEFP